MWVLGKNEVGGEDWGELGFKVERLEDIQVFQSIDC